MGGGVHLKTMMTKILPLLRSKAKMDNYVLFLIYKGLTSLVNQFLYRISIIIINFLDNTEDFEVSTFQKFTCQE